MSYCSDEFVTQDIHEHYDCYRVIRLEVEKIHSSGVDVKAKIGKDLIGRLDQMFQVMLLQNVGNKLKN